MARFGRAHQVHRLRFIACAARRRCAINFPSDDVINLVIDLTTALVITYHRPIAGDFASATRAFGQFETGRGDGGAVSSGQGRRRGRSGVAAAQSQARQQDAGYKGGSEDRRAHFVSLAE